VKVSDILCGNKAELGGNEQGVSANDLTLFKYSPFTSCDVDRSFSSDKVLLSYNRRYFSLTILKCMSSTATLPKTKTKLGYEFSIIVKSKHISPFIMQSLIHFIFNLFTVSTI